MKTWHGRIRSATSPRFETFTSSVQQDRRLARYDIRTSQAQARALGHAGIISREDANRLTATLDEIAREIEIGQFEWRDELEDVHTHVESRLRDKVGALADTLHTGRSRNDQIAADLRLFVKDATLAAMAKILDLQAALLSLAERQAEAIMPGYTHLQQAQPVLIAQPLLAYVAMLGRDWERLRDSVARTDRSPLGSGALGGATFTLDRELLAAECGFTGVIDNSLDAVSDRDFLVEFVSAATLCLVHLSRFAEDVIIGSSLEFGFIRLPDAFASGSSMMPQKKNPDVLELIRGKAGLLIGDLTGTLSLMKGLPLSYNRDFQAQVAPLYQAADSLLASLDILVEMVPELEFDVQRTEEALSSYTLATDLADYLVEQGVPFREAHAVVGQLVARSLAQGRELDALTLDELRAASPHFDRLPDLNPRASVRRKRTAGSTHPEAVEKQLKAAGAQLAERREWTAASN